MGAKLGVPTGHFGWKLETSLYELAKLKSLLDSFKFLLHCTNPISSVSSLVGVHLLLGKIYPITGIWVISLTVNGSDSVVRERGLMYL